MNFFSLVGIIAGSIIVILSMITNWLVRKQKNLTSGMNGWMAGYLVRMVLFLIMAVFFSTLRIPVEEKNQAILFLGAVALAGVLIDTMLSAILISRKKLH